MQPPKERTEGLFYGETKEEFCVSWQHHEWLTTTSEGFVWWLPNEAKASQRGSFQ